MLLGTIIYAVINSVILILMSIGFNLTFGISGISNFAYGALYILAAFVTWMLIQLVGLPYLASALISILFTAFIGALMYRFILMRVRGQVLSEVIATFGIGLAILEFFRYLGFVGVEYALPVFIDESFMIGDVYVDAQRILIVAAGIVLVILLWLFVHYTSTGLAFRGIAQDERTALTFGMDSDRIATLSVSLGAGLAAIAATVIIPLGTISVSQGYDVLINALAVSIIGGLGSTGGVIEATKIFGGTEGISGLAVLPSKWLELYILMAALAAALFGFRRMMTSDYGLVLTGIKDNDRSVMNAGINIYWFKIQSLFIAGSVGAFAGAMMTHVYRFVGMPVFALDYSILPIAFDKTLLSMGESIGGLFLPVKGYFGFEKQGWRCGWERKEEHRLHLLRNQPTVCPSHPSRRHF